MDTAILALAFGHRRLGRLRAFPLSLIVAPLAPPSASALTPPRTTADVRWTTGSWDTGCGVITLAGGQGSYAHSDGRILGSESGGAQVRVLSGIWSQSSSGKKCSISQGGSNHWGRFAFTFDAAGNFTGQWSYCDDAMQGGWNGTKRRFQGRVETANSPALSLA